MTEKIKFYTLFLWGCLVLCGMPREGQTQDFVFSQFYTSPTLLNPAFAGNNTYPVISMNYRLQWPSITSRYESYAVAYDQYFKQLNSGFGFNVSSDNQGSGIFRTLKVAGVYSYKMRFKDDWQLKFGLEVAGGQTRLDWDKLIFFDQIDPVNGPLDPNGMPFPTGELRPESLNQAYLDVSTGFLLYNPLFYVGLSLDHINSPYNGFYGSGSGINENLPVMLSLHGGMQIVLEEDNKGQPAAFISPNALFAVQGDFYQVNVGAYAQINPIFGGLWFRHTFGNIDALIFSAGIQMDAFKVGYSFDLTTSKLGIDTGGSHELGIIVRLEKFGPKESKLNDCLGLFR